jgi:hypothetical protein
MTTSSHFSRTVVVACAALLLCVPALWNGLPFFYPDTPTYLRGAEMATGQVAKRLWPTQADRQGVELAATQDAAAPSAAPPAARGLTSVQDKIVLAGRSIYYGGLLHAAQGAGSVWLAVVAQALCVAAVLHLVMVTLWRVRPAAYLATMGALSLTTPLAVYSGLLMPDVFAGLTILGLATLAVYWRQLSRMARGALAGVLLFGLLAHASHVAVAAVLLVGVLALRRWNPRWQGMSAPALVLVAACIGVALAAEWAFAAGVQRAVGAAPLRLPYPTARLIEMGPGTRFVQARCPEVGYAVCAYAANYPTAWDAFLFSDDPARGSFALADADTKRRIVAEQGAFVRDVIAYDPVGVLTGWAVDLGRQLLSFRVDVWSFGDRQLAMYEGRVPPQTLQAMQASKGLNAPAYNRVLSALTYASTGVAVMLGAWWAWRRRAGAPARVPQRLEQVATLVLAGVAANALVCVTAASSLDRFQSRVIWLLPFLALTVLAWCASRSRVAETAGLESRGPAAHRLEGAAS